MKLNWQKALFLILRLGFGILLIIASVDKLFHPQGFAVAVDNYRVVGEGLSRWVAIWIPYLEAITGLFLIIGLWLDAAVLINAILMLVFLALVSQAWARGLDITCGCFAVEGDTPIGLWKILENLGFLLGAVFLFLLSQKQKKE